MIPDLRVLSSTLVAEKRCRVVFLFKRGRKGRYDTTTAVPTEFLYGFAQFRDAGIAAATLDEDDIGLTSCPNFGWRIAVRLCHPIMGFNPWVAWHIYKSAHLLRNYDVIVATTNSLGLALAFVAPIAKLNRGIIFIAMGLLGKQASSWRVRLYRRLIGRIHTALISRGELGHLQSILGTPTRLSYLPFGIDHRFWTPDTSTLLGNYVLSIGNDQNRDYDTLVAAWKPHFPTLKIVTNLSVEKRQENIELIAGDWAKQHLTDAELRELVRGALFVVLPIRNTVQPSGQSACLQAMACGKAVVISDIIGLWDRDVMRSEMNCILVAPESRDALTSAIEHLLECRADAARLGTAARITVVNRFNVDCMASALYQLCLEAAADAAANWTE